MLGKPARNHQQFGRTHTSAGGEVVCYPARVRIVHWMCAFRAYAMRIVRLSLALCQEEGGDENRVYKFDRGNDSRARARYGGDAIPDVVCIEKGEPNSLFNVLLGICKLGYNKLGRMLMAALDSLVGAGGCLGCGSGHRRRVVGWGRGWWSVGSDKRRVIVNCLIPVISSRRKSTRH